MGFLKELFEKKLKASTSISNRDFYADGESPEVPRSAQSEWALPQLACAGGKGISSGSGSWGNDGGLGGSAGGDSVCYLQTQQSAKSFSFAAQRKQQLEQAEKVHASQQQQQSACCSPAHFKYESLSQFSQKVELYRGSVATVFKAVCVATGCKVIVKAYYKSKMHPKHYHKLYREIESMKVLNGPYVAEFFSTFEDAQCIFIVMELCEGGDLFKTMLMHGGLLDEQWVCVEVITPLLRILEKMHSFKLLHRDIKPENIFLTALGKFRLGDFGLAINFDRELAFSRSGTLDYMAPEVLKNPSVPFQESKSVDLAMLSARGVKPYGPPVDVWAAGVLAYELVCGRPPFEVDDEAQTAALIMYSDSIKFPPNRSALWSDFVRTTLVKAPDARPSATALLKHPWIVSNLQRTLTECNRPSKEMLLQPLPLNLAQAAAFGKVVKRTLSLAGSGGTSAEQQAHAALPALPAGGVPAGSMAAPALPAAFPATPTGAARNMQHVRGFGERDGREARTLTASTTGGSSGSRLSGASGLGCSSDGGSGLLSPSGARSGSSFSGGSSSNSGAGGGGAELGGGYKRPEAAAGLSVSLPQPQGPKVSFSGATGGGALHLSHLHLAAAGSAGPAAAAGAAPRTPTGRTSAAGSPLKPALGLGLKVMLPPETEFELCGSSDSFCYSPTTPAPKAGIKERMKFYFQRQAGSGGGF